MLLIIKRLNDEALMVRKNSDIDTIKDTIKLIHLLVKSLNDDKILLSLGTEILGGDCVFRELGLVKLMLIYMCI